MLEPLQGAAGRRASENQPGGDARVCPAEAGTRALLHGLADNLLSSKGPGCRPQTGRLLDLRSEGWSLSGVRSSRKSPQSAVLTDTKREQGLKLYWSQLKIRHLPKEYVFLESNSEGSQHVENMRQVLCHLLK